MSSSKSPGSQNPHLIVVSNRLPVSIKAEANGGFEFGSSSGGLVSAFSGLGIPFTWTGWPDIDIPAMNQESLKTKLSKLDPPCVPVWVDKTQGDKYYNGYSNSVLWPLFHYHQSDIPLLGNDYWNAYDKVNEIFAKAINAELNDGDLVWIQDYHLMLVPQKLRELTKKNIKIGWFLHTPFPEPKIFKVLPARDKILRGVLHSDLLGFHTMDYAVHFLNSCKDHDIVKDIPNLSVKGMEVKLNNHNAHVGVFPIGIDPKKFTKSLNDQSVKEYIKKFKGENPGVKIILGIDRLDYIKGIPEKMEAMRIFLSRHHKDPAGKVVLIQIAVPTRPDVEEYKKLRADVQKQVDDINNKYPGAIKYRYEKVAHDELVALYAVSDVCLVTSTRDGMNLVAYEYISSKQDKNGVLILSEFAGAAKALEGSLFVNPHDANNVADKIHEALSMKENDRHKNYDKLWRYVEKNTAARWGEKFVGELKAAK